jgi:ribonuclease-3
MEDRAALDVLQQRIGHRFADRSLLLLALTHRSYSFEQPEPSGDNERLEFLGDAVLGMIVAARLYERLDEDEGRLTQLRAELVAQPFLAAQARELGVGDCLRIGRGERASGGAGKDSILACAMEAILGAVFQDGGFDAARRFVDLLIGVELERILRRTDPNAENPRGALQELAQARGFGTPDYDEGTAEGPPNRATWTREVRLQGEVYGRGSGGSKREAAEAAAREALARLRTSPPPAASAVDGSLGGSQ